MNQELGIKNGLTFVLLMAFFVLNFAFFISPAAAAPPGDPPTPTAVELPNPLGTADFAIIIGNIIKVSTGIAGSIALLVFVYGGFQWLTAAGNPEKIKKGRDILLWALLGIVVMFSSYIITNYLLRAILAGAINP